MHVCICDRIGEDKPSVATQDFRLAGGRKGDSDRTVREGQGCCSTYAQLQGWHAIVSSMLSRYHH